MKNLEFRQQSVNRWKAGLKNQHGDHDEWEFILDGEEEEGEDYLFYILDVTNFDLNFTLSGELLDGPFENAVNQVNEWFNKYILDEEE